MANPETHSTHPDVLLVVSQMAAHIYANRQNTTPQSAVTLAVQIYLESNNQLKTIQVS